MVPLPAIRHYYRIRLVGFQAAAAAAARCLINLIRHEEPRGVLRVSILTKFWKFICRI